MRKVLSFVITLLLLIVIMTTVCFAGTVEPIPDPGTKEAIYDVGTINAFVTYEMLAVFSSLVAITFLVVEYLKEKPFLKLLKTKDLVALVACVLIILTAFATKTFYLWGIPLYILSAIVVTFSATGVSDYNYKTDKTVKESYMLKSKKKTKD